MWTLFFGRACLSGLPTPSKERPEGDDTGEDEHFEPLRASRRSRVNRPDTFPDEGYGKKNTHSQIDTYKDEDPARESFTHKDIRSSNVGWGHCKNNASFHPNYNRK